MYREPARSPHQAEERYKRIIGQSLTCLTDAVWLTSPPISGPEENRQLYLSPAGDGLPPRLRRHVGPALRFEAKQVFVVVADERFSTGEWKVSTREYKYAIYEPTPDRSLKPVMEWHWHPTAGSEQPHMHVRSDAAICGVSTHKLHIPTERVAFESVAHFLISELDVVPRRHDWRDQIEAPLSRFKAYRTWPRSTPLTHSAAP